MQAMALDPQLLAGILGAVAAAWTRPLEPHYTAERDRSPRKMARVRSHLETHCPQWQPVVERQQRQAEAAALERQQ